ncbi:MULTISPECIES: copper-binding protein [unclassified Sphingomonas]|uniref:copper-binding protein n=1 Tax=Sphingomonas TaxID=13687 RepID=UPI000A83615C|nr:MULTISPECIES: copper-binding protein [unclassified Sphingomonas]MBN8812328.1 copper-binding protein [Sphingomonas sp.]
MKPLYLLAMITPAMLLAACGEKAATNATAANTSTETPATMAGTDNMSGDMGNMAMPDAKTAKGSGTVTAIDKAAGTITLDHGAIPEAGWPAMTMAFKAAPALLDSVKVGDKVAFELALKDGSGEVTSITKQ